MRNAKIPAKPATDRLSAPLMGIPLENTGDFASENEGRV
jgi:hypothetical protein